MDLFEAGQGVSCIVGPVREERHEPWYTLVMLLVKCPAAIFPSLDASNPDTCTLIGGLGASLEFEPIAIVVRGLLEGDGKASKRTRH